MRLLASTDLGIKILVYMAANPRPLSRIAEMNTCFQMKVTSYRAPLRTLVDNDVLVSYTGRGGGYSFKRDPAELSLGEMINLLEGDLRLVPWLQPEPAAGVLHPNSIYRFALEHAKTSFLMQLDNYTIAQMAADPYTRAAMNIPMFAKKSGLLGQGKVFRAGCSID